MGPGEARGDRDVGLRADASWRLNVLAGGAVEVQIAGLRFTPRVRSPEQEEAVGVVADYERRNRVAGPIVRAVLSRLAGFRYDGSTESRYRLTDALPLLAFRPRTTAAESNAQEGVCPRAIR